MIEMLTFRRPLQLMLFGAGLVCSMSGTGWLMIFSFAITAALSLGGRGVLICIATVIVGLLGIGGLALFFPAGYDQLMARTDELSAMGSSGHLRFVTPWWIGSYVLGRTPWAALYGVGAGVAEHLGMRPIWDYDLNPPVKIALEYGFPGLFLYEGLFLLFARRTRLQRALLAPVLVMQMFSGGYQQFAPVLFPSMLLILLAELIPFDAEERERQRYSRTGQPLKNAAPAPG
jgi:hypothetical protein